MSATVKYNAKSGKYELNVDGVIVAKGSEAYMRTKMKQYGVKKSVKEVVAMDSEVKKEQNSEFGINERFEFLAHFTKMVATKKAVSLVVSGPGGLGKTFTVMDTLEKCGLKEDTIGSWESDYLVVKGFTTPKALYRVLWENNGKVIIFDDCDAATKDPIAANLLKAALDSGEKRVVSWNAEFSDREEMPNRFSFTGSVIFISNLSMDKIPQAIQSRAMRVSLDMTTDEKVERISTIMQTVKADDQDKADVVAVIKEFAASATDLNVRAAMNILKIRQSTDDATMFRKLARYSLVA